MSPGGTPAELAALLAAIADGNPRALSRFYDLTAPIMYGRLLRMLQHPEWAKEALQDCYIRVWQHSASYSPDKGEPIQWLTGVARYRALDLIDDARKRSQRFVSDVDCTEEWLDPEESAESRLIRLEKLVRLTQCMQTLTQNQRRCILLGYYEGRSHRELALEMNVPLGTVKAWLRRGVVKLRECLAL